MNTPRSSFEHLIVAECVIIRLEIRDRITFIGAEAVSRAEIGTSRILLLNRC